MNQSRRLTKDLWSLRIQNPSGDQRTFEPWTQNSSSRIRKDFGTFESIAPPRNQRIINKPLAVGHSKPSKGRTFVTPSPSSEVRICQRIAYYHPSHYYFVVISEHVSTAFSQQYSFYIRTRISQRCMYLDNDNATL